ncbi:hypothetical protein [Pararhodobacter sp.]|uniref:hypothetical protein n=1 Tax=Pararhodobacter sp. TaxID=2127056 RepID=UPI002AFF34AD|nr:hypothetical protein [Pararhodobacter sp.]
MTKYLTICAALALTGCGSFSHVVETYGDVRAEYHEFDNLSWRIMDNRELEQLVISASPGRAFGNGFAQGATLGLSGPVGDDEADFRAAAASFLAQPGRGCTITEGTRLQVGLYEYRYSCGA